MINDSQGQVARAIHLQDSASKGRSGRVIPLSDEVRDALIEYRDLVTPFAGPHVICTERSLQTSAQAIVYMFQRWYRHLGFLGCSSHSGRRTFITGAASLGRYRPSAAPSGTCSCLRDTRTCGRRRDTSNPTQKRRYGWSDFYNESLRSRHWLKFQANP